MKYYSPPKNPKYAPLTWYERGINIIKVVLCAIFIAKNWAVTTLYFRRVPYIMTNDKYQCLFVK